MKKQSIAILALALLLLAAMAVFAGRSELQMSWDVIGGGGGRISSAHVELLHTIGQPFTGSSAGQDHQLAAGFWPGIARGVPATPENIIYMPVTTAP